MQRLMFAVAAILIAFVAGRYTARDVAAEPVVTVREVAIAAPPVHCPRVVAVETVEAEEEAGVEIEDTEAVRRLDEESKRIARIDPVADERGVLRGAVNDLVTGEYLAGVTIVAWIPSGVTQTAISDERGNYEITNLAPGNYTVTMYYLDSTIEHPGITINRGMVTPLHAKVDTTPKPPVVIQLDEGITIDDSYVKNIRVERYFEHAIDPCALPE